MPPDYGAEGSPAIRRITPADHDVVVDLALRAWAPVFASIEEVLRGSGVFEAQHPDWRAGQETAVRTVCAEHDGPVWVIEVDRDGAPTVAGFVAARLHPDDRMGEIAMVAVDPASQRGGLGSLLTEVATRWVAEQGMTTVMVETGGDPGHAPARATYEKAGFTPLPVSRYVKRL